MQLNISLSLSLDSSIPSLRLSLYLYKVLCHCASVAVNEDLTICFILNVREKCSPCLNQIFTEQSLSGLLGAEEAFHCILLCYLLSVAVDKRCSSAKPDAFPTDVLPMYMIWSLSPDVPLPEMTGMMRAQTSPFT